jgi:hypothetical protein
MIVLCFLSSDVQRVSISNCSSTVEVSADRLVQVKDQLPGLVALSNNLKTSECLHFLVSIWLLSFIIIWALFNSLTASKCWIGALCQSFGMPVCMWLCVCVCVWVCVGMCVCTHGCGHVCVYTWVCVCVCIHTYGCEHLQMVFWPSERIVWYLYSRIVPAQQSAEWTCTYDVSLFFNVMVV